MEPVDAPLPLLLSLEQLDQIAAAILVTDEVGNVLAVSRAAADLLGYARDELVGRDSASFTHPDDVSSGASPGAAGSALLGLRRRLIHKNGQSLATHGTSWSSNDGRIVTVLTDVTAAVAAELAQNENVERLQFMTNAVPALIGYVGIDTRYVWGNESYQRWFGYAPETIRGHLVSEVLGMSAWSSIRAYAERALAGEEVTFAHRIHYKSGPARDVRATYVPDLDADGRVRGFVVLSNDISEIKATEMALRRSEHLLEQAQSTAHVGSWEMILESDVPTEVGSLRWSDEAYRIFGYQPHAIEVTPATFFGAIHPEDLPAMRAASSSGVKRGEPFEKEYRIVRPDGTIRVIHAWSRFDRAAAGRTLRMLGTFQDITERKQVEQEGRQAREELELVMDSTAASIARCDRQRRIVWTNKSNAARVGKTPKEIVGRPLREIEGEAAYLAFEASIDRVLAGETVVLETEVPHHLLGSRWVHIVYSPTFASGKPDGWVSVLTDNTQRRELERERERALRELREADRRKDEFLAMLSHELRNPLAPILSAVEVLGRAKPDVDERTASSRSVIARQVHHMKRLLDDLLDVSRVSQGKITLHTEPVELGPLLLQAVEVSRPMIVEKRQELTMTLPPHPLPLDADPTRLVQVFANLVNNAAKYSDIGGHIAVTVTTESGEAVVSVRDDGMGMRPELLARAFDIFVQETRSLDRAQGGLGIGLTMVQTMVKMHGGSVRAFSEGPGRGSELVVRLPLSPAGQPRAPSGAPPQAEAQVRPLRVLVVDDNEDAAQTLGFLLEQLGHHVTVAYDGPGALEAAAGVPPEVVLLDIGLPGMDGYAVATRLRDAGHGRAALIALTGYGQDEHKRRASEAGFDQHIVKPVDFARLREILAQIPE